MQSRWKKLSLACALVLSFVAVFTGVPLRQAEAACPATFCATERQSCLAGCPCADFYCNPASCWSDCVCPIVCLD